MRRRRRLRWLVGIVLCFGVLSGIAAWFLLRQKPITAIYGDYPPDSLGTKLRGVDNRARRPNVVLVVADDLGYGDLGAYGGRVIRTPHIDALAEGGIRFTDFHSCSAVCAPARAALLTGRYPFRTGIVGNTYPKGEKVGKRAARRFGVLLKGLGVLDIREDAVARGLADEEITLAEGLREAGYRTGMVGKWHLGDYAANSRYNPLRHGFDSYLGVPYSNDMLPFPLYRNETVVEEDLGHDVDQARLTGLYTEEALRFIRAGEGPFFLYLAHTFPHQPLFASEEFENRSAAGRYGDVVEEIDAGVGRIVEAIREMGVEEETLVIITSDNGPWYEGSAGGLRGRKGQSMEGGFRVPFIAYWPGVIPEGRVSDAVGAHFDLYPTLFALAGLTLPEDRIIDGRDMLPRLTEADNSSLGEPFFYYHYDRLEAVRWGDWKYYRRIHRYTWPIPLDAAPIPDGMGRKQLGTRWPLLYNLKTDPEEAYNLLDRYPDVAEKMEQQLRDWEAATNMDPRGFQVTG